MRQTELFVILGHFLPYYSPSDPENQYFQKMKKKTTKTTTTTTMPGDLLFYTCVP